MSSGLQIHHLLSRKTKQLCEALINQTGKDIISIYDMTTISSYAKNTWGLYFFKKIVFFKTQYSGFEFFSKNANVVFIEKSVCFLRSPRLLQKNLVFGKICILII